MKKVSIWMNVFYSLPVRCNLSKSLGKCPVAKVVSGKSQSWVCVCRVGSGLYESRMLTCLSKEMSGAGTIAWHARFRDRKFYNGWAWICRSVECELKWVCTCWSQELLSLFRSRMVIEAIILELWVFTSRQENRKYIYNIVTETYLCGEFSMYLK